jgi:hypothetical protein
VDPQSPGYLNPVTYDLTFKTGEVGRRHRLDLVFDSVPEIIPDLLYCNIWSPDISFVVKLLSRFPIVIRDLLILLFVRDHYVYVTPRFVKIFFCTVGLVGS